MWGGGADIGSLNLTKWDMIRNDGISGYICFTQAARIARVKPSLMQYS